MNNNNEFIIKEACVLEVNTGAILFHHVAKPPFDREIFLNKEKQRDSHWVTQNYHGLEWNSGDIPYHNLMSKLCECLSQYSIIYVKGMEKKLFVSKYLLSPAWDEVDSSTPSKSRSSSTSSRFYSSPALKSSIVIDMAEIGCRSIPSIDKATLSSTKVRCKHHKSTNHCCALSNCTLLRYWLLTTANEEAIK